MVYHQIVLTKVGKVLIDGKYHFDVHPPHFFFWDCELAGAHPNFIAKHMARRLVEFVVALPHLTRGEQSGYRPISPALKDSHSSHPPLLLRHEQERRMPWQQNVMAILKTDSSVPAISPPSLTITCLDMAPLFPSLTLWFILPSLYL